MQSGMESDVESDVESDLKSDVIVRDDIECELREAHPKWGLNELNAWRKGRRRGQTVDANRAS